MSNLKELSEQHKIAMAVHGVMNSISDLCKLDELSPRDLEDIEISHACLARHLEALRIRRAA